MKPFYRITRILLIFGSALVSWKNSKADNRIIIEAEINQSDVRMRFDTGADRTILFARSANQRNIQWEPSPADLKPVRGKIALGRSEECDFTIGGTTNRIRFGVLEVPSYLDPGYEGILSWNNIRDTILKIEAAQRRVTSLETIPAGIEDWSQWPLASDVGVLVIDTGGRTGGPNAVFIDSGRPDGVQLSADRWKEWKSEQEDPKITIKAGISPAVGLQVYETWWADQIKIGSLTLRSVPVSQVAPSTESLFENYEATIGMIGLSCLEMVIDGAAGRVFTRENTMSESGFDYNRLGAVFVPAGEESDDLVAHVIRGSPAYQGGIRNGDILLKLGDLNVTKWRSNPELRPGSRFWHQPAGTSFAFLLQRGDETVKMTIKLEEIFPLNQE